MVREINSQRVRSTSEPATSEPMSIDTSPVESPPTSERRANRPAELAGLRKSPASSSRGGLAMGSRTRRASLPPFVEIVDPVVAAAGEAVKTAIKRRTTWQMLVGRPDLVPKDEMKFVLAEIEPAKRGLEGLALMRSRGSTFEDADETEALLVTHLAMVAGVGTSLRCGQLVAHWTSSATGTAESAETDVTSARPEFSDADGLLRVLDELNGYRSIMEDFMRRAKARETSSGMRAMLTPYLPSLLAGQRDYCTAVQTIHGSMMQISRTRLENLAQNMALPALGRRLEELNEAIGYRREEVVQACLALEEKAFEGAHTEGAATRTDLTPEALATHKAVIEKYGDTLERITMRLCLDAAEQLEAGNMPELSQNLIALAHAISAFSATWRDICERVGGGRTVQPSAQAATISSTGPSSHALQLASRSGRKNRQQKKRSAVPSHPAPIPVTIASDARSHTQKDADALLKKYPLDLETAGRLRGDIVAIASMFGKDTSVIQRAMSDPQRDAVQTINFVRGSANGWLGEIDALCKMQTALAPDDTRIEQLTDRISALTLVHERLEVWEADELKNDHFPRSNHLERLLNSGEIHAVGIPVRLISTGDAGNLGTLFEMRIQPKPLSNGTRASAWFVHLHTCRPVDAAVLRSLDTSEFTAVHLKTDQQKNLGQRWETMMHALGYVDAKVHRAAIGATLLGKLFALAPSR